MNKQTVVVIFLFLIAIGVGIYYLVEYMREQEEIAFKQQQLAGLQAWELPETGGGFMKLLGFAPLLFGVPPIPTGGAAANR